MKIERADRNRPSVTVPTRAEIAYAEARGIACTSELIGRLRAQAGTAKRSAPVVAPTKAAPAANPTTDAASAKTIKILQRQIEQLKNDNCKLQIQVLQLT